MYMCMLCICVRIIYMHQHKLNIIYSFHSNETNLLMHKYTF